MKSQLQRLCAMLGATFLVTACDPLVPEKIEVNVNITSPQPPQATGQQQNAAAVQLNCTELLTVKSSNDGHLKKDQEIRITGPNADGSYRLYPIEIAGKPSHQLLIQEHTLAVASQDGKTFTGVFDVKAPQSHGPNVSRHLYTVTLEFTYGCPSKMTFDIMNDTDSGGGNDHGGHGVAD